MKKRLSVNKIFKDYQRKQLMPPFKNDEGQYVNQFGELIDMDRWDDGILYHPNVIKKLIKEMKEQKDITKWKQKVKLIGILKWLSDLQIMNQNSQNI